MGVCVTNDGAVPPVLLCLIETLVLPMYHKRPLRYCGMNLHQYKMKSPQKNMVFQILCLFGNNAPVAATQKKKKKGLSLELKLILASEMKIYMTCGRQTINALKRCFWCWKYQTHSSVWWQQMPTQPSASDSYCNSVRLLTWKGRLSIPHSPTEYSQTILLAWNILFGLFSNPCSAVNGLLI